MANERMGIGWWTLIENCGSGFRVSGLGGPGLSVLPKTQNPKPKTAFIRDRHGEVAP
jgi:hypothetical protein